jgi:hypothetical protein
MNGPHSDLRETAKLAILWHGDHRARHDATPQNNRLNRVFEALAALGVHAEPAVYADDFVREVRDQLLQVNGVLVWVNPISEGQNRIALDAMLREVASKGVWVSAHPDVILKMGVKEVLYRTRHLAWGTDTYLYRTGPAFKKTSFPSGFNRRVLGSSNKTVAMAVRACGKSSSFRRVHARRLSSACCMRAAVACPKSCRSATSLEAVKRILPTKVASSINHSNRGYGTE